MTIVFQLQFTSEIEMEVENTEVNVVREEEPVEIEKQEEPVPVVMETEPEPVKKEKEKKKHKKQNKEQKELKEVQKEATLKEVKDIIASVTKPVETNPAGGKLSKIWIIVGMNDKLRQRIGKITKNPSLF